MKRRDFLVGATAIAAAGASSETGAEPPTTVVQQNPKSSSSRFWNQKGFQAPKYSVSRLTHGPENHFFGYYGMSPWSADESKLVCLQSIFHDRLPTVEEKAKIGLVDQKTGAFTPIAETLAWNLQQGSLIHWNPLNPNSEIIYNDRTGNHIHAQILNVETGEKRALDRPINGVGTTGRYALSMTMGRLGRLRKVVGYAGAEDPNPTVAHPDNDGIFRIDLETGESKLIVSIKRVFEASVGTFPILKDYHMWFNHTVLNPSGTRFLFLARWRGEMGMDTAMFTANIDGSDLRQVVPFGTGTSHFGWRTDDEIVATFKKSGVSGKQHYLFKDDEEQNYRQLGKETLVGDGHCSFNKPGGNLMATDRTEGDHLARSLWLYDLEKDLGIMLSSHSTVRGQWLSGDIRCDFHPRWSPSGNRICYDAIDSATHTRQMHIVEFL